MSQVIILTKKQVDCYNKIANKTILNNFRIVVSEIEQNIIRFMIEFKRIKDLIKYRHYIIKIDGIKCSVLRSNPYSKCHNYFQKFK